MGSLHRRRRGRYSEDIGNISEYGLCFDYVVAGTFTDQKVGYFRYQLSCGGPSKEFRIYTDRELNVDRIEFWFLDWFDGAKCDLDEGDFLLLEEIFESLFKGSGYAEKVFAEAQ